jgi:hypothetical protein
MGPKAGEKWTAAAVLQPTLPKSDRLLDATVDADYQPSGGKKTYVSDAERVAFLFELYQRITSLLPPGKKSKGN